MPGINLASVFMATLSKAARRILPSFLKQAIKRSLGFGADQLDVHFRVCSPATPAELAQCIFELQRDGLLNGRDYYEFGLFRGYALWFVQDMARRLEATDFRLHGFDSFAGLPEPVGIDKGEWAAGQFAASRAEVVGHLRAHGADLSAITLHEGFFSDELFVKFKKEVDFRPAALVLVDCDLYSSTVPVLKFLAEYLAEGSILLFDDYNCFHAADDRGERRAFREFLQQRPSLRATTLRPFGVNGQGFRIKVSA